MITDLKKSKAGIQRNIKVHWRFSDGTEDIVVGKKEFEWKSQEQFLRLQCNKICVLLLWIQPTHKDVTRIIARTIYETRKSRKWRRA